MWVVDVGSGCRCEYEWVCLWVWMWVCWVTVCIHVGVRMFVGGSRCDPCIHAGHYMIGHTYKISASFFNKKKT